MEDIIFLKSVESYTGNRGKLEGFFGRSQCQDSCLLEQGRDDEVALQERIEIGPVAIRDPGCLADIAFGHLQEADQIFLLEAQAGLGKGRVRGKVFFDGVSHQ